MSLYFIFLLSASPVVLGFAALYPTYLLKTTMEIFDKYWINPLNTCDSYLLKNKKIDLSNNIK
jgi:hypothetical protein